MVRRACFPSKHEFSDTSVKITPGSLPVTASTQNRLRCSSTVSRLGFMCVHRRLLKSAENVRSQHAAVCRRLPCQHESACRRCTIKHGVGLPTTSPGCAALVVASAVLSLRRLVGRTKGRWTRAGRKRVQFFDPSVGNILEAKVEP